jgi:hypothetical protein
MAAYTSEEVLIRRKRYMLETPWPQGAAIAELYKLLAAVENVLGDDVRHDDRAWVKTEDDRVVVFFETEITLNERDEFGMVTVLHRWSNQDGRCDDCNNPAAYVDGATGDGKAALRWCAVCAAGHAAGGVAIRRIDPEPAKPFKSNRDPWAAPVITDDPPF